MRRPILAAEAVVAKALSYVLPSHLMRNPAYFGLWERRGYHVTAVHFYSPIPGPDDGAGDVWPPASELVGVDLREQEGFALLERLSHWRCEYDALPKERADATRGFFVKNDRFSAVDAEAWYAIIRERRPRQIVEIGSGFSTRVASLALAANERDGVARARLTAIDPFAPSDLDAIPQVTAVLRTDVQQVDRALFDNLREGDVLFIDSSHVLRHRSDVQIELLEIVPRLSPGVLVHFHDVFLPFDYPARWRIGMRRHFNEQYLLQAFLTYNERFEIRLALRYLAHRNEDALRRTFASYDAATEPGSFWIERVR